MPPIIQTAIGFLRPLYNPAKEVKHPEARMKATALAVFLLVAMPLAALLILFHWQTSPDLLILDAIGLTGLIVAYGLSRSPYTAYAPWVVIITIWVWSTSTALAIDEKGISQSPLIWLILTLPLAYLFLSDMALQGVLLVNTGIILAYEIAHPGVLHILALMYALRLLVFFAKLQRRYYMQQSSSSEARFQAVYDRVPVGITIGDIEGNILQANQAFCEMLGYDEHEILRLNIRDFTPPEDLQLEMTQIQPLRMGKTSYQIEKRYIRKDGSVFLGRFTGTMLNSELGVGMIEDITAQRENEAHIRRSGQSFRRLSENSPDLICRVDLNGYLLYVNRHLADAWKISPDDLIGKHFSDVEPDKALVEQWSETLNRCITTSAPVAIEFTTEMQDGLWYFQSHYVPEFDDDNRVESVLVVSRNITDLRQYETALKRSEERYRNILNALPDMIMTFDRDGHYLDAIPSAKFPPANPQHELIGKSVTEILGEQAGAGAVQKIQEVLQTGKTCLVEYERDGHQFEMRLLPFEDEQVMAIIRDITSRASEEANRMEATRQEERVRVMQRFMEKAAHDLLTPLTIMQTNLYLMMRTTDDTKTLRRVEILEDQTAHIEELIRDLLKMSQMNRDALDFLPTDLQQLVWQTLREKQTSTDHPIHLQAVDNLPLVEVDQSEIRFVLNELLDNALVHSQADAPIIIQLAQEEEYIRLSVIDQGEGIPARDLEHIFEPFYRAFARQTNKGGFGLGLTIVLWIIQAHNGDIEVISEEGKGSTFHIRLPLVADGQPIKLQNREVLNLADGAEEDTQY